MEGEKILEVVNGRREDTLLPFTTSDIFSPSIYNF
jgi:hypothetical protein